MADGGLFIPPQLAEYIRYATENMRTYYDTETKGYHRIVTEEAPLVMRKYPAWKFWKHGWLILNEGK